VSFFEPDNLRQITAGRFVKKAGAAVTSPIEGVSTDTRTLGRGQVFVALRGERFDGHDHLAAAAEAGAPVMIVDREQVAREVAAEVTIIHVPDTTAALGQLAAAYRKTLPGRIIAVTGSVGKTTTKQLIHAVLSTRFTGKASPKSFNNHIGVPLTLLSASPADAYVICEVGTNAPGEIAALGRIIEPDIAVITAVGVAHLEGLGSVEAVLKEKASLLSHLREGGLAIVNGDVPGLVDYRRIAPSMIIYGLGESCHLRLTKYTPVAAGAEFEINGRWRFKLPLLGEHNARNALAAVAVARHMKLTEPQIAHGLDRAIAPPGRLRLASLGTLTIIDDSYNANPDSMAAALRVLESYPAAGRRVAVLGDMLELGADAPQYHRALGEAVATSNIDLAVFVGRLSLFAAEVVNRRGAAGRAHAEPTVTDAGADTIAALLRDGDTVLLKASRGIALERLLPALEKRFGSPKSPTNHSQACAP
jgi:UDP-N-acetylmuramoyl-tripeptide--D-alanyl-D-alanine ligase